MSFNHDVPRSLNERQPRRAHALHHSGRAGKQSHRPEGGAEGHSQIPFRPRSHQRDNYRLDQVGRARRILRAPRQLAALGRYLVDNGGYPSYAVNQIAHYSVPVYPQAASPDPAWNKAAEEWFADWSKRADFTRRFDFATLQRLACKAIDTEGDTGVALTLKSGFPQLRPYDCFQIGSIKGVDPNDGVRVDGDGALSGYQVIEGKTERVLSANEATLLYDTHRFACYRGFSPFRRGSNDIRDSADIKAFEKLAVKIASALAAVIEQDGPIEENVWGNDTGEGGKGVHMMRWNDATSQHRWKKNGGAITSFGNTGYGGWPRTSEIGHGYDYCNFDCGAILVYDNALSDADCASVESYFNAKFPCY